MLPCRSSVFVCQAIVLLLLLFSGPCQGRATDDQALVQYKVIATPKGNMDLAVVIDDVHMYRMTRVSNDSVLYAVSAPAAAHGYRYTQLNHATQKNETTEAFVRAPRQAGLHEFYGRQWVYRRVKTLPTLKSLPQAYDRRDVDHLHPQNEIPTLHLQAPARDIDNLHGYYLQDISIEANATYITAKHTMPFQDVKISLSGRSTRYFSKLSYNLNLPKGGKLDGYKKLKLRACGADPSFIREKLAYDMLAAAGRPGSRSSYVRLIINDRAIGLFLLIERYDDHWLRNEFAAGDKHYANGILYKGDGNIKTKKYKADLSYHGNATAPYEQTSYSVEVEPKQDDKDDNDASNKHKKHKKDKKGKKDKNNKDNQAAAGDKADDKKKKDPAAELGDLIALTKFIDERLQATNNKTALNQTNTLALWNKHFDIDGYFINLAFEFLMGSFDTYLQNTNNYFLYKDPEAERFVFVSWDMDMVLGSGPVHMKSLIGGDYASFPGMSLRPLTKASVLGDPVLRARFEHRLKLIVKDLFAPNITFPVIDSLADFLREDATWDMGLTRARHGASFLPFGPHNIDNWFHNNATNGKVSRPITVDYLVAIDFIARVNAKISLDTAVHGPTHYKSLYALKTWITTKTNNVMASLFPHH